MKCEIYSCINPLRGMIASQRIFLKIQGGTRNTKYCVAVIESHKVPIHFYLTCMFVCIPYP